jgi:hypothetical protein
MTTTTINHDVYLAELTMQNASDAAGAAMAVVTRSHPVEARPAVALSSAALIISYAARAGERPVVEVLDDVRRLVLTFFDMIAGIDMDELAAFAAYAPPAPGEDDDNANR